MADSQLGAVYGRLKQLAKAHLASNDVTEFLINLTATGHTFLRSEAEVVALRSKVPGKQYWEAGRLTSYPSRFARTGQDKCQVLYTRGTAG